MNLKTFITQIAPRGISYKLARAGLPLACRPITLTHSVTFACQSRCKTCNIGHRWLANPELSKEDLTIDEIDRIYAGIGPLYFFNISGGEPFLRDDLPQIVKMALKHLNPAIVHTPTNAILSEKIRDKTVEILEIINKHNPNVPFTVKPSIDGVGEKHDAIRGVTGNFKRLLRTIELLKEVEKEYENFHLELGTVISNFNINDLDEIEDFVHSLEIQSYRNEIAECREEFFNIGEEISPSAEVYEKLMKNFKEKIQKNVSGKRSLARTTEAIRLVYYDLVPKILKKRTQVIACYAGLSNVHLNYDGKLWPCCVLGYAHQLGDFRETKIDYSFNKLMKTDAAQKTLKHIRNNKCFCPLANQSYSNILYDPHSFIKVLVNLARFHSLNLG